MSKIEARVYVLRGLKADLPDLRDGELAYCTDTNELFVGTLSGNVLINEAPLVTQVPYPSDADFSNGTYTIPGESTKLFRVQNKNNSAYTVMEVSSPESSKGADSEATLTLMREQDSESGGAEFLDLFNNGYADSREMGLRVQTRRGTLRSFIFDFFDGAIRSRVMKLTKDYIFALKDMVFPSGEGNTYVGYTDGRFRITNDNGENTIALYDDGFGMYYSLSGDFSFYLDNGFVKVNDVPIQLNQWGVSSGRPVQPGIGTLYFDSELGALIVWNGSAWLRADGNSLSPTGAVSINPSTIDVSNGYIRYRTSNGADYMFILNSNYSGLKAYISSGSKSFTLNQTVSYKIYKLVGSGWVLQGTVTSNGGITATSITESTIPVYTNNTYTTLVGGFPYVL